MKPTMRQVRRNEERRKEGIREGGIVDLCEGSATTLVELGDVDRCPALLRVGVGAMVGELLNYVCHCEVAEERGKIDIRSTRVGFITGCWDENRAHIPILSKAIHRVPGTFASRPISGVSVVTK